MQEFSNTISKLLPLALSLVAGTKEEKAGKTVSVRALISCIMVSFLLCVVATTYAPAFAQVSQKPKALTGTDREALRSLYRVVPKMAEVLERDLKSAATPKARRDSLDRFYNRFDSIYLNNSTPNDLLKRNIKITVYIVESTIIQLDAKSKSISIVNLNTEDDIIQLTPINNYKELYDFLREAYSDDFGFKYIDDLKKLNNSDRSKYLEALHKLVDDVEKHQKSLLEPGSRQSDGQSVSTNGTGDLFGKELTSAHLQGCGNGDPEFSMKLPIESMPKGLGGQIFDYMGMTMSCPLLLEGKRVDFQKACNESRGVGSPMTVRLLPTGVPTCWPNDRKWGPPKPGEATWGINTKSLSVLCLDAYQGQSSTRIKKKNLVPILKYGARSLYVDCFYIARSTLGTILASK